MDVDQSWTLTWDELTGSYKDLYNNMTDAEKNQFEAIWENAKLKWLDAAKEYANFMRDYQTTKSRQESDQSYMESQYRMQDEAAGIQESQSLRRAATNLSKLKQSTAYLWTMWVPGVSAERLNAVEWQIKEAERSYRELQRLVSLSKSARSEWFKQKALEYERQFEDLDTKLNDNVNKAIQDSLNSLMAADANGKLDTTEELETFRVQMLQDLDKQIAGVTDANIKQRQFLIDRFDKIVEEEKTTEANNNIVNKDMSAVKWYYVNDNWTPIYDASWATIKIPKAIPEGFEPFVSGWKFFSPKIWVDGEIVLDENGSPIFNSTQLEDEVSVTSQLSNAYIDMVNKGVMTAEDAIKAVPSLATNEAFIKWLEKEPGDVDAPKIEEIIIDWEKRSAIWNNKTGKYEAITDIWQTDSNISEEDATLGQYELTDWTVITATKWTIDWLNNVALNNPDIQFDLQNLYRTQEDQYKLYGQWRTAEELAAEWIPEQYADPEANQVTWTTKSSHMTGNAVDVVLPEGEDKVDYYNNLDAEMKKYWFERPEETKALGDYGHYQYMGVEKEAEVTPTDVMTYNSSTFKPQKDLVTKSDKAKYKKFLKEKKEVMNNKESSMEEILEYSAGWKDLTDTSIKSLEKYDSALSQLSGIQEQISEMKTWPVIGRLKNMNPYDTDAQALKAQLTALIPNLARWVYGEVWVLTDNDVRLYSKTIPNLTSTEDVNKAVLAMTLKVVAGWYKRQLQSLAAAWKDVSWFSGLYNNLQGQVEALENSLPTEWEAQWGSSIKELADKYTSSKKEVETTWDSSTNLSEEELMKKYYK